MSARAVERSRSVNTHTHVCVSVTTGKRPKDLVSVHLVTHPVLRRPSFLASGGEGGHRFGDSAHVVDDQLVLPVGPILRYGGAECIARVLISEHALDV